MTNISDPRKGEQMFSGYLHLGANFFAIAKIFLTPQVNSLAPHLFSHSFLGAKEFTYGTKQILVDSVSIYIKAPQPKALEVGP